MKRKNILTLIFASIIGMTLASCSMFSGDTPKDVKVTGVFLDKHEVGLLVNQSTTISATVEPNNATNKNVTWTVSDESIFSYSNGTITAKKKGEASLTVSTVDGNYRDVCRVTVSNEVIHVESISINKSSLSLYVGQTTYLTASVLPNNATDRTYSWSSNNTSIATINDGLVEAKGVGDAVITVTSTDGAHTDTCAITVSEAPEDVDEHIVDDKYQLNDYGDYFEYIDSSRDSKGLTAEYASLTKEEVYYSEGIFKANYQVGLYEFFNIKNKVDITINISNEELNKLEDDYQRNNHESFRICALDISYLGLHFHYEEVGIRQKGNTSRGAILKDNKLNLRHYKLSFEETFDDEFTDTPKSWSSSAAKADREDRKFFGENKIDIRWNRNEDKTYLKEYYAFELHRANGSLSPRSNPVHVTMSIDGSKQNMGVYLAVETINKSFIKRNFIKSARNGDLYKISWGSNVGGTFKSTDSYLFGVETQTRNGNSFNLRSYTYDLKTNKDTSEHVDIKAFINNIQDSTNFVGNNRQTMMQEMSVYEEFIAFSASLYAIGDPDDLRANCNNAYLYFAFVDSVPKAVFIPIDQDRAFGCTGNEDAGNPTGSFTINESPYSSRLGYGSSGLSDLYNKTIVSSNSTAIRSDYIAKLKNIATSGYLDYSKFESLFNLVQTHYSSELELGDFINYHKIDMSTDASSNINDHYNLKMSTYLSGKKNYISNF